MFNPIEIVKNGLNGEKVSGFKTAMRTLRRRLSQIRKLGQSFSMIEFSEYLKTQNWKEF